MKKSTLVISCTVLLTAMTLLLGCKKKNQAPNRAAVPSGPAAGYRDSVLTFTSSATDPDGDSVAIRFDWGDGDTSGWSGQVASGATVSDTHRWVTADTYEVRAQAKDAAGTASDWSTMLPVAISAANQPPSVPAIPTGQGSGRRDSTYIYTSIATDPEGSGVSYRFDWGDGDTSAWSAWLASGTPASDSHSWSVADTYLVRAQAKDIAELRSDWSQPFAVAIVGGWSKTFGGADWDNGYSVQQTSDGGYIIAGYTGSYGAGKSDVYLIKTDASGNQAWTKTFGGSDVDQGYSVQQTSDGGYIIAGTTASYGAGSDDFWLIKTDASGGQVWAQTFGGTGWDDGSEVSQTSDGGYIIVGTTSSYGAGSSDIWLIKTDAFGNQTWAKTFGGTGDDQGYSVRQTSDGGYVIVGQTDSYGAGGIDIWLIKTDASGNQIWTKTFGGWTDDYGYSVRQTSDGGYIIVGETDSYGGGNGDAYLIKTDVSGTQVWTRTFGGANSDAGYSVQQTPDGGYILVGQTSSYVDVDSGDVYVVKTDASGNQVWARTVGGAHPDYGNSVQLAASGGYIIAGSTFSYGAGGQDVWLIKTDADGNTVMSSRPFASSRLNRHDGQTSSSARPSVRAPLGQTHPYGRARRIRGE